MYPSQVVLLEGKEKYEILVHFQKCTLVNSTPLSEVKTKRKIIVRGVATTCTPLHWSLHLNFEFETEIIRSGSRKFSTNIQHRNVPGVMAQYHVKDGYLQKISKL